LIIARPTVAEERWLVLASRYPALRTAIEATGQGGRWKATTLLGRCLGFLLGLFGVSLLAGALSLLPEPLLIGGLVLVGTAEWLVAQRRVFRSGIEEAVYLCGAIAIVVQLLIWVSNNNNNEALAIAIVASAVLFVGWRLLNPFFTTLAAVGYSLAIAFTDGGLFSGRLNTLEAGVACVALAVVALIAGGRQWQRPAHDRMLDGLVITMPWLAQGWLIAYGWGAEPRLTYAVLALALGFFAVNAFVGVRRGQHAPLIGALGNLVCAGYAIYRLLPWPLHWLLITAGVVLLASAVLVERSLRHRSTGITSRAVAEPDGLDLLQVAAAAHLAPSPGASVAGVEGKGGSFGGGGASGQF
jgi:hypothetical protein